MWSFLIEPFVDFAFMRGALLQAFFLGISFSAIGVALVSRRLALIGDTMSHAMLPGVVLASAIFGASWESLVLGGGLTAFVLAWLAMRWREKSGVAADSALALFAVFSVAVGILISSKTQTNSQVMHLLFGNILAGEPMMLLVSGAVCLVTVATVIWGFHAFSLALIDPEYFQTQSSRVRWWRSWILLIFAANLTVGFATLGAMMTVGLLIIPALAARPWVSSVFNWLVGGALAAVAFSFLGILLSYHGEFPPGPMIVVVASASLAIGAVLRRLRKEAA